MFGVVFLSFSLNDILWKEHSSWFQRSGAVVIFLAAIIEYRHIQYYPKISISRSIISGELIDKKILIMPCQIRNWIGKFGILYLIIGTLIWGYGDLLFDIPC
jgi:hypothetical protein